MVWEGFMTLLALALLPCDVNGHVKSGEKMRYGPRRFPCPPKSFPQGNACVHIVHEPPRVECPTGTTPVGKQCEVRVARFINCPTGFTADGKVCHRERIVPAQPTCSPGYTLTSDLWCTRQVPLPNLQVCPIGSDAVGKQCIRTTTVPATPVCSPGYVYTPYGLCSKQMTDCASKKVPVATTKQPATPQYVPVATLLPPTPVAKSIPTLPASKIPLPLQSKKGTNVMMGDVKKSYNFLDRSPVHPTSPALMSDPATVQHPFAPPTYSVPGSLVPTRGISNAEHEEESRDTVEDAVMFFENPMRRRLFPSAEASCTRVQTVEATFVCPPGSRLEANNQCLYMVEVPPETKSGGVTQDRMSPTMLCPANSLPLTQQSECSVVESIDASYSCPSGARQEGDTCVEVVEPRVVCPFDFVLEDQHCIQYYTVPRVSK